MTIVLAFLKIQNLYIYIYINIFIIKQSTSHKTKRRNKKQSIHNHSYVAQTNNRRNKHNIQEHVSKQSICCYHSLPHFPSCLYNF